jgi:beta-lactamase regulating signal transducer with metallopeptidase domain
VAGLIRPTILLPAAVVSELSAAELEPVIVHELVHVARHDLWLGLLQAMLGAVYFFHPIVWWTGRRLRALREDVCDGLTVALLQERRIDYAAALVKVTGIWLRSIPGFALGLTSGRSAIGERVRRILDARAPMERRLSWRELATVAVLALVLVPFSPPPAGSPQLRSTAAIPARPIAVPEQPAEAGSALELREADSES